MEKALVIAHRGASLELPENSIEAIQLALDLGSDGVEFDLQLTKDHELVLFHDAAMGGKLIIDSLSTELGLPRFADVLALKRTAFYMVELKSHAAIAEIVAERALAIAQDSANILMASFCPKTLEALQRRRCPFPCYAIAETRSELAAFGKVDGYALHYSLAGTEEVTSILQHSRLFYWTVDSLEQALSLKAHGIITNDPRTLLSKINYFR